MYIHSYTQPSRRERERVKMRARAAADARLCSGLLAHAATTGPMVLPLLLSLLPIP